MADTSYDWNPFDQMNTLARDNYGWFIILAFVIIVYVIVRRAWSYK